METEPTYFQKDLQSSSSITVKEQIPFNYLGEISRDTPLPFCLIGQVLRKVQVENATTILITPAWQAQSWYPKTLHMSIHNPVLISKGNNLLIGTDFQ